MIVTIIIYSIMVFVFYKLSCSIFLKILSEQADYETNANYILLSEKIKRQCLILAIFAMSAILIAQAFISIITK